MNFQFDEKCGHLSFVSWLYLESLATNSDSKNFKSLCRLSCCDPFLIFWS